MRKIFILILLAIAGWALFPREFGGESFSSEVMLVSITAEDESQYGELSPVWRKYHAALIDRLSQTGAKVIIFDLTFESPGGEETLLMASAIETARSRGTSIVVAVKSFDDTGNVKIAEPLVDSGVWWGISCFEEGGGAFPLIMETPLGQISSIDLFSVGQIQNNSDWALVEDDGCPILQGHEVTSHPIEYTKRSILKDPVRRFSYKDIFASEDLSVFKRKIVIVGREIQENIIAVRHGFFSENRYGIEVHADAINTLLNSI